MKLPLASTTVFIFFTVFLISLSVVVQCKKQPSVDIHAGKKAAVPEQKKQPKQQHKKHVGKRDEPQLHDQEYLSNTQSIKDAEIDRVKNSNLRARHAKLLAQLQKLSAQEAEGSDKEALQQQVKEQLVSAKQKDFQPSELDLASLKAEINHRKMVLKQNKLSKEPLELVQLKADIAAMKAALKDGRGNIARCEQHQPNATSTGKSNEDASSEILDLQLALNQKKMQMKMIKLQRKIAEMQQQAAVIDESMTSYKQAKLDAIQTKPEENRVIIM